MTRQTKDPAEQEFNREVGARLQKLREVSGVSRAELAGAIGVSRQSVYNWETGQGALTPINLGLVAWALDVPADELVPKLTAFKMPRPLVVAKVRTRRPEDYELVDHANGTRWEIRDGTWKPSERA